MPVNVSNAPREKLSPSGVSSAVRDYERRFRSHERAGPGDKVSGHEHVNNLYYDLGYRLLRVRMGQVVPLRPAGARRELQGVAGAPRAQYGPRAWAQAWDGRRRAAYRAISARGSPEGFARSRLSMPINTVTVRLWGWFVLQRGNVRAMSGQN